jgi:hypothetical protein
MEIRLPHQCLFPRQDCLGLVPSGHIPGATPQHLPILWSQQAQDPYSYLKAHHILKKNNKPAVNPMDWNISRWRADAIDCAAKCPLKTFILNKH